jgi:mannitol/fructose-specific phosphotransferase system IIA component (Ntr-type)
VFCSLYYIIHLSLEISLLVAAISITTAPGSTLHIIQEKRGKGILTKTILAVVALNNVLTILVFYGVYYFLFYKAEFHQFDAVHTFLQPLLLLLESIIIGGSVGFALIFFTEKRKIRISFLATVILAVVITVGTSELLHLSGILSSLILGIVITNYSKYKATLFGAFKDIEIEVFTLFFVLAGTHLDLKAVQMAGIAGIALIIARLIGKTFAPTIGAYMAGSTQTIKKWIGISLYPIAGVAIGLVLLIENNAFLNKYSTEITAIVLTAVVVNELLGPIFTGLAIKKSGEEHKNRMRLMDFLQEEYIKINLDARDKWDALDQMAQFLFKTHKIIELTHAIVEGGPKIRGVIGISKTGIPFESIDDKPVNIVFLLATPRKNYDLHLHVLANIAKIFGHHPHIKDQIIHARSPEEVFEILQAEEVEELNPFFEY